MTLALPPPSWLGLWAGEGVHKRVCLRESVPDCYAQAVDAGLRAGRGINKRGVGGVGGEDIDGVIVAQDGHRFRSEHFGCILEGPNFGARKWTPRGFSMTWKNLIPHLSQSRRKPLRMMLAN